MVTEQQFRQYLHHLVDAENARAWGALDELLDESVSSDYVGHLPGAGDPVRGLKDLKQWFRNVVASMPGFHSTIEDAFMVGDRAAARFTARRTDPATGKTQRAMVILIRRLEGGRFAEDWELPGAWENDA